MKGNHDNANTNRVPECWPELMSKPVCAAYLCICKGTLMQMVAAGKIPVVQFGPRLIRFRKSDIDKAIAKLPNARKASLRIARSGGLLRDEPKEELQSQEA